jgi:hypothetical protein
VTPLVYVAGAYSSDPVANTRAAIEAGMALWRRHRVAPVISHLSLLADLVCPMPVEEWYALDLVILERCDAVLRLEGASAGADAEVVRARELGLPVFGTVGEVGEWATAGNVESLFDRRLTDEEVAEIAQRWRATVSRLSVSSKVAARIADLEARLADASHRAVVATEEATVAKGILRKQAATGATCSERYLHCGVSVPITDAEAALFGALTNDEETTT